MKVLGIDPGSHLGWGLIEDGRLVDCGLCREGAPRKRERAFERRYKRPSGKWVTRRILPETERYLRFIRQGQWIRDLVRTTQPDIVGIEATPALPYAGREYRERERSVMFQFHAVSVVSVALSTDRPGAVLVMLSPWDWKPGGKRGKFRVTQGKGETLQKMNRLYDCAFTEESARDCDIADGVGIAHAVYTQALVGKRTGMDLVGWFEQTFSEARAWTPHMK